MLVRHIENRLTCYLSHYVLVNLLTFYCWVNKIYDDFSGKFRLVWLPNLFMRDFLNIFLLFYRGWKLNRVSIGKKGVKLEPLRSSSTASSCMFNACKIFGVGFLVERIFDFLKKFSHHLLRG